MILIEEVVFLRVSLRLFLLIFIMSLFCEACFAVSVSGKSAILYEPQTKTVLFSKDADTQRAIASTTKIMTAVVALETLSPDMQVTIPKSCVGIEGTSMYLKEGEKLTVEDLLYGLMLSSGNDAAVAIAYFGGGGNVSAFVELMNEKAKELGMENSSFKNPNGLSEEGHFSTARDMAILASYAMENPKFSEIVSTKTKTVAGRALSNHNKLLRTCEGAEGVKTGFTKAAGRCLVSSAKRGDMRLVAVTLAAPDDWNDHSALFDYGFSQFAFACRTEKGAVVSEIPVVGAEGESVSAIEAGDGLKLLDKAESARVKRTVFLPRFIYAPVSAGDVIGKISYSLDGVVIDEASLVAGSSLPSVEKPGFLKKMISYFRRK